MSNILQRSLILNERLSQVTNQESIAQLIQSWKPVEDGLGAHIAKVREQVRVVEVFIERGVMPDNTIMEGININPLLRDLSGLKGKFSEDRERIMHGKLWTNCSERLIAASAKLDARLKGIWKSYVEISISLIKGLDELQALAREMPEVEVEELIRVNEDLASLQQRSRALSYDNPADTISIVQAYCSSISKAINKFETTYRLQADALLENSVGLRDQLILEDESIKHRIDSVVLDAKAKLEQAKGEARSYRQFIQDVCEVERAVRDVWSECVQSLVIEIQYVGPFLESDAESRLMDQIIADQSRLRVYATSPCSPDAIAQVNRLSSSIKDQIKTLFDKADLSGMPENVSAFMKKLQREGATLEDLQGGVFEWLQLEGKLKHFKLK